MGCKEMFDEVIRTLNKYRNNYLEKWQIAPLQNDELRVETINNLINYLQREKVKLIENCDRRQHEFPTKSQHDILDDTRIQLIPFMR